jgi:hypothetical protein
MARIAHYAYPIPGGAGIDQPFNQYITVFSVIDEFPAHAHSEIDSVSVRDFLCIALRITPAIGISGHSKCATLHRVRVNAALSICRYRQGFAEGC